MLDARSRPRSNWLRPNLLWALAVASFWWLVLADRDWWFHVFPNPILPADFQPYFAAARIGLEHGWQHIYNIDLQRIEFYKVHPATDRFDHGSLYVTPPPVAWLVAPLAATLPYTVAFWFVVALLAGAYAIAGWWITPGSRLARATVVLAGATTYPVLICIAMGQVAVVVGIAVVVAWVLLRRGHQLGAGLVLSVIFLKPQVAHLVPLAILAWGAWRSVAVSATVAGILSAACLLSLGGTGIAEWMHALAIENSQLDNQIWTPAVLTGAGAGAYLFEAVAAILTVGIAFLSRRQRDPGTAIVAALVGSLLAAPYHHGADSFCLVAAFWIMLNLKPSMALSVWLAFGAVAAFFEPPTGPAPLLVFASGWLLILLYQELMARAAVEHNVGMAPTVEQAAARS
jgi:hypothetical protein